jgi:hypothetical protein
MTLTAQDRPQVREWIFVFGCVWFLAGFIGPMIVVPSANQGPMVGIFITGPLGVVTGAVLGGLSVLSKAEPRLARRLLYGLAGAGVIAIVYFVTPSPRKEADIVAGTLEACRSPATLRAETVARMQSFSERQFASWGKPNPWTRDAWEERFDELLATEGGVILTLHTTRIAAEYRGKSRWDDGRMTLSPWSVVERRDTFYVPGPSSDCRVHPVGAPVGYRLRGLVNIWEPRSLPELMNLYRAEPAAFDSGMPGAGPMP